MTRLIEEQPDMVVIGEAATIHQTSKIAMVICPNVIVVDMDVFYNDILETLDRIKKAQPECRIVLLSENDSFDYVNRALISGISGYVLKSSDSLDIIQAIRSVYSGKYYFSPKINTLLIGMCLKCWQERPSSSDYDLLGQKEQQVFRLLVEGATLSDIARKLEMSPRTVRRYRSNIMKKLNISDSDAMLDFAAKIGIIGTEPTNYCLPRAK